MINKKSKIYLSSPHMSGNEMKYIQEAFDTNWVASFGENINSFEKGLCNFLHAENAVGLSSGTAAIHLALILLGVEKEDEVLCSSFTFSASANPIVYQDATPVFIDSEPQTWNMDPELLENAIKDRIKKGKKPKALILVHLYGMPAKVDEIKAVVNKYDIPIVEDAAEALGSKYKNRFCGTFGKIGILSFNGNKIITTSGGGALITNSKDFAAKTRFLAAQARDRAPHYQHSVIGYNYLMSNVLAGIGRAQMEVIEDRINRRRAHFNFYKQLFKDFDSITLQEEWDDRYYSNYWLTTIQIDPEKSNGVDRETLRLALEEDNIESRPLWKPMHMQPVFSDAPCYTNGVSEKLFRDGLCLPSGSNMTADDLARIEKIVRNTINR